MTEFLDQKIGEIKTRMEALRPLVEEHEKLTRVMQALGPIADGAEPVAQPVKEPVRRSPRGHNQAAVLELLRKQPGQNFTATNIADQTGIGTHVVRATLDKLVTKKEIVKSKRPDRTVVFRVPKHRDTRLNVQGDQPRLLDPDRVAVAYSTEQGEQEGAQEAIPGAAARP